MSREHLVRWTCDGCNTSVELDPGESPAGWGCIAVNADAVDPSWDHDGWRRFQFCPACAPEPGSSLNPMLETEPES